MRICTKTLLALSLAFGVCAQAETRQVGKISWEISSQSNIGIDEVPDNMSQLIFVRLSDGMTADTNANIAIDSDYQISLSPGHASNVLVCIGDHKISSQITANKSNNLNFNQQTINTEGEKNYFYQVKVDEQGNTFVTPINPNAKVNGQNFIDYIAQIPNQNHQLSRVVVDCPPAPTQVYVPTPEVEVVPEVELFVPYRLDVLFEFDKAVIQPIYNARIQKLADYLAKYPDTNAIIEGHTDSIGSEVYNQKLSEKRAEAVRQELIDNYDVDSNRLRSTGYGERKPVTSNSTVEGRQQNRRVVAVVSPK